jgi:hypothetical protein
MPKRRVVEKGDCALSIGAEFGGQSWEKVWNAPENQELRAEREPFTLAPGDKLVVPDVVTKKVTVATGQTHKFVITLPKARVRVRLLAPSSDGMEGVSGTACRFQVKGVPEVTTTTDADGWCEAVVPARAKEVVLAVEGGEDRPAVRWKLAVGALGPAKSDEGAAARLANLGYAVPGEDPIACLPFAMRAFQEDAKLEVTGELDDATADALRERHGV